MARVKVQAYDTEKAVVVEEGATKGATLGVNVYDEDGNVLTLAQLIALANDAVEDSPLSATAWRLIQDIPPNVTALANTATTGLYVVTGPGTSATRTIQPVAGETTVANGDGVAGNPAVGLANLADAGGGSFLLFVRDAKGRVSGTSAGTAAAVPVTSAGWTQISGANAQAAFDSTDTALAGKQPLDATLTALASANWALNALPIGTGADTVSQVAFAANTFPARASTGNLEAKAISDFGLSLVDDASAADARVTLGAVPGNILARVYRAATQSVTPGAFATIVFDTENFDVGSNFNTATGEFTAPVAGIYAISGFVHARNLADGSQIATSLFVNGVETARLGEESVSNPTANTNLAVMNGSSTYLRLAASDVVTVRWFCSASVSGDCVVSPSAGTGIRLSYFFVTLLIQE